MSRVRSRLGAASFFLVSMSAVTAFAPVATSAPGDFTLEASSVSRVSLGALLGVASMSGVSISPDGKYVSVRVERVSLTSDTIRLEWDILELDNGKLVAQVDGGEPDWTSVGYFAIGAPEWSADSRWLYFTELKRGILALWRLGVTGRAEEVVVGPADIDGFLLDSDNHRVLYWIGPTRRALEAEEVREVSRGVILNGTQDVGMPLEDNMPYRAGIATMRIASVRGQNLWLPLGDDGARTMMVYDLDTGQSRVATPSERLAYQYNPVSDSMTPARTVKGVGTVVSAARSARTGDVAFISYKNTKTTNAFGSRSSALVLGLKRARNGKIVWCEDPRCRDFTGHVVARPGTNEFVFATFGRFGNKVNRGVVNMYEWSESQLTLSRVFHARANIGPVTGLYFGSDQCPVTKTYAVCVDERTDEPPILEKIDLYNGRIATLFDPNTRLRKGIANNGFQKRVKYMVWKDERGLLHSGVFLSPLRGRSAAPPLVITSYDCLGFLRGGTGQAVPEFVLAEDGFAVLCSNFDDSLDPPSFHSERLPPGQVTRMEYTYDGWKSAVQLLASNGEIDPMRVGISGLSFTGDTVNWVIAHHPHFAAAATAGQVPDEDAIDYYILAGTGGKRGADLIRGIGLLDPQTPQGVRYYRVASDALNAAAICTPLLLQTDEAEFVPGIQYYGALRLDHAPMEFIVFPREAHLFWQPQHLLLVEQRNIDWFRFWLQHHESRSGRDHARYARWDKIRARWERTRRQRPGCSNGR